MSSLYTAKELAAKLGVDPSTIRRWVNAGLVTSSEKSGGISPRRRYTEDDLLRARMVQALLSVPIRRRKLRIAVARAMGAVRAG